MAVKIQNLSSQMFLKLQAWDAQEQGGNRSYYYSERNIFCKIKIYIFTEVVWDNLSTGFLSLQFSSQGKCGNFRIWSRCVLWSIRLIRILTR